MNTPKYIIVHCSDVSYKTSKDQLSSINQYHRDVREFPVSSLGMYVGYHRLITGGRNVQCRLDSDEGAHCNQKLDGLTMNLQSLGVCIAFDGDVEYPSQNDAVLLRDQIWQWQDMYSIPNKNVLFHRDFAVEKTCPGKLITRSWLENLIRRVPKPPLTVDSSTVEKFLAILRSLGIIK